MLSTKLRHVEADIRTLIVEQQASNSLGQLGLSNTCRPREECDTTWPAASSVGTNTCHRALDDIHHMHNGMVLTLHALLDESLTFFDLFFRDVDPMVFSDADLVVADRITRFGNGNVLTARKLRYRGEIEK